jgi:signal transduction histidine kinase
MERRPGIAYRRPDGDPTRFVVEAADEPRLNVEALPRTGWLDVVAESDRNRLRSALDGEAVDVTYRLTVDDEPTWVHECGKRAEGGDVVGYLFPAGEQFESHRQLERERERLAEFASVVSHDLRNPLSVAVGNLELATDLDGDAADERLNRAHDALGWMDDLISDLLALAREGRSVEETTTIALEDIVRPAWRTVGDEADAALVVDDSLPAVDCDGSRLRQVFENLFRNSIEHGSTDGRTQSGGRSDPAVQIVVGPLPDGFYVADDGPGIPPGERDTVFDPGHSTADGGTGFGLAIVERIAEAHGWSISVTEGRDGGARFEFTGVDCEQRGDADGVTIGD